jgi:hypothetical protein
MTWKEAMRLRKAIAQGQRDVWYKKLVKKPYIIVDDVHVRLLAFWDMVWATGMWS